MSFRIRNLSLVIGAFGAFVAAAGVRSAEVVEVWEGRPYCIEASLVVAAPGDLRQQLEEQLPQYLAQRANTSIGCIWRFHAAADASPLRYRMLDGLERLADKDLPTPRENEDKRLLLAVRATPWGFELSAREFDRYVERWGSVLKRLVRQREVVPEQLFALAEQAVSPLAHVIPGSSDSRPLTLELRGADLPPSRAGDFHHLRAGDVLQPFSVRKDRVGTPMPGGTASMPWTYIEVDLPSDGESGETFTGRYRSVGRPTGVRRGGRTEIVAIGMRHDPDPSTIELRARGEKEKPLAGYEVFVQGKDSQDLSLVGKSDEAGNIRIEPGETGVRMVYVKSDGVTLALLPVVPGAQERITVPLPDDDMRLRAAARLAALREDIVDVVARRTIYMARVRQQMREKNFEEARGLLRELDELPGVTQFRRTIDLDAQLMRTDDAQVQRRIDKLFSDTRGALGKFLNPQPVAALHEELRQAELRHGAEAKQDEAS